MKPKTPKNIISKFIMGLAAYFLAFSGDLSALELRVGGAGVMTSATSELHGASALMPLAALQTPISNTHSFKLELGAINYTVDKKGEGTSSGSQQMLRKGELDVIGYSLSAILVTPIAKKANFNIGLGAVRHTYKSRIDSSVKKEMAAKGITNIQEEIADTGGAQIIFGVDVFVTETLLVGLSCRMLKMRPDAGVEANYPSGRGTSYDNVDLSHELIALTVMYQFGL